MVFSTPRTMRVALFRSLLYDYIIASGDSFEGVEGFMRVSEYVQVDFPPLDSAAEAERQQAEFDRLEAAIHLDSAKRLADIRRLRSNLQAANASHEAREVSK
jgi:hypothetical protein